MRARCSATFEADAPAPAPTGVAAAPSGAAGGRRRPAAVGRAAPSGVTVAAAASGARPSPTRAKQSNDYGKLISEGDRLSENGHAKEARKLYDKALAVRPNGLEAIMGLGYCDLDGEKFSSAVDHFKRALALSPSYGDAIIGLAEAYKLRGDKREALSWYKQYLSSQPNGPKATMAKNNIRDLEPKTAGALGGAGGATSRSGDGTPVPPPRRRRAKKPDEAKKPDDDKPVQLPRPPTSDEPPP